MKSMLDCKLFTELLSSEMMFLESKTLGHSWCSSCYQ